MRPNTTKRAIKERKPTIGTWLTLASPLAAERLAYCGFDWLTIDLEHGPTNWETAAVMAAVIGAHGVTPLVRIPSSSDENIKRALDLGVGGVVAPMVVSADQARSVVASCKYPPVGVRSLAGGRNDIGWATDAPTYFSRANDEIFVCVQIEHPRALERLDEILSTPGIDCAFVGPQDLTATLGIQPPQLDSPDPRYEEALVQVLAACGRHGVGAGLMVASAQEARRRHEQGFTMVALAAEARILASAATAAVKEIKGP
jgi:4-hydroxy-2-oxoheptanedioate aldolase